MMPQTETITKMFKALSDETRLRTVNILLERELCVCELMSVIGSTQSKTSRHLAYLKNAGLAKSRRKGLWIYYSLKKPRSNVQRRLLDTVRESRRELGLLRRDLARLEKEREGGSVDRKWDC
jgi:ArsR family transcriptional regulator